VTWTLRGLPPNALPSWPPKALTWSFSVAGRGQGAGQRGPLRTANRRGLPPGRARVQATAVYGAAAVPAESVTPVQLENSTGQRFVTFTR